VTIVKVNVPNPIWEIVFGMAINVGRYEAANIIIACFMISRGRSLSGSEAIILLIYIFKIEKNC
jgi:hypothetical protein